MCTTFFAVTLGLVIANLFKKGFPVLSTSSLEYTAAETPSFIQTLIGIFPSNIIQPMAEASMLQVIVVALLFGFGTIVAGKKGEGAFGISHNVGTVHLHEVRLYKKSGLAGTGTTDYKYVFVSRILRLLWSARHHKPFRCC